MNPALSSCLLALSFTTLSLVDSNGQATANPAPKIISLADFGVAPDTKADATVAFQKAFAAASNQPGPVVLQIPKGEYELNSSTATRLEYHISNTSTQKDDQMKVIGLYLKGIKNLTIEGNGSLILCHGKMTMVLLDSCENVTIRNLHFDYAHPTVVEMTVKAIGDHSIDFQVHPDSSYKLEQNILTWFGEDWQFTGGGGQEYDPTTDTVLRCRNPLKGTKSIEETSPKLLHVTYDTPPHTQVGHVFQIRDGLRDEVGMLLLKSHNITLQNLGVHFMHGLGIVGQFTDTITFQDIDCAPRAESGRTCAGFADFMHLSGCRGKISILNCRFSGAQDDPINIHGTHLQIQEVPAPNQVLVAFMQVESWGFEAFFPGDEIDFTNHDTLVPFGTAHVVTAESKSPTEILLTLDQPVPAAVQLKRDVVENVTATPEVEIRNCQFSRTSTRGLLVSTRRKVVIEDNTFTGLPMPSILIADDARSWFESGMVRDVLIRGNHFIDDVSPVIAIRPALVKADPKNPVHENIRIEKNEFRLKGLPAVSAKSVRGLSITDNSFSEVSFVPGSLIDLTGCLQVSINGNTGPEGGQAKVISMHGMDGSEIALQADCSLNGQNGK